MSTPETRYFPCTNGFCSHLGTMHNTHCTVSGCVCTAHVPWDPPALLPDETPEERDREATLARREAV